MKIGIIGSGGREHALCYALKKSKQIEEIWDFTIEELRFYCYTGLTHK